MRFLAPLDGDFGGSWLAANEYGLTLALHNGYAGDDRNAVEPAGGFVSRGLLLTSLIDAGGCAEVVQRLRREELGRYRSFLLTAFAPGSGPVLARWIGGALQLDAKATPSPPLVSSAFDGERVRARRAELFRRMRRARHPDPESLHLAYHRSHAPRRGALSPCMHRPEARTVSFSWVRVDQEQVRFAYAPHPPCLGLPPGDPFRLKIRGAG